MDKSLLEIKEDLLKIIEHFGISNQQRKLQEEIFELQQAITIFEQGNNQSLDDISEELVDVMILLKQIFYHYELNNYQLLEMEDKKIKRTLERIENDYYEQKY